MSAEPTPRARHRLLLLASSVTLLLGIIPAAGGATSAQAAFVSHDVSASDAQDEAPIAPSTKSTSPVNDGESYGLAGAVNQPVDDGNSGIKELVIDEVASPAFDGQSYGDVGQYETIEGRAFGELDPKDPLNAIIQDIELAPTNDDGMVEYVATFFLVKPIDMSRSSGLMWQYVPNRGGRITLPVQNREQGDIGLSSGWQGDDSGGTAQIPGRDWVHVPTAMNLDGSAITGEILGRIINAEGVESSQIFIHSNPVPYEPRTLDTTEATLTIIESETHDGQTGVTREVPSSQWAWANCTESNPFPGTPDPTQICVDGGFEPNRVYQVVFTAQDPPVLGIGFAAFRDVGSFFKYQDEDDHGTPNPLGDSVLWILSRGSSQSGTMLRQFIHLGFNQDTAGRQVQDGTWPWVASRRIGLNFRFAVPDGVMKLYEPGTEGPLWWSRWPDRARDLPPRGILDRCQRTQTCPKIIETAGASEVWGQRLSVSWVGTDAKADIPLPPNVRRYYIPSTTHGGGNGSFSLDPASPPNCPSVGFGRGVLAANPVPHTETRNAIESHFRNWLMKDIAPPPSQWPRLRGENPTLVEPTKEAMGFPTIPGLEPNLPSDFIVSFLDYDFGPEFNYSDSTGVRTVVPPVVKQVLPTLVPRVDEDGNELGGVPVVLRDAPLGTYLGWNSVAEGFHQGQICGYQGGMIPFAKTKAERLADGDPRLSLEERYGNHAGWVEAVKQAAANAMAQGFLLPADAESLIQRAEAADEGWPTGSAPIELVIESTSPVNDGESYGTVGPYERLRGYALGELDPSDPANRGIVNLDRAPRNAVGNVEYRVDVEIQRPVDPAKANATMLYEVVNRGRQLIFGYVNRGTPLLYESGFTLVWSGWQGDISREGENLIGSFPIATNDGEPIMGTSREEFVDMGTDTWTGALSYPAATLDSDEATLTVRENERDPRVPVTSWRYVDDQQIEVRPPGAPYDSGAIFEFIYPARDPIVTGIGFAATRDVNSYLRFGGSDGAGNPNPLGPAVVQNALAAGISQSGRFLRDFIYQGFNEDLQGRKIFEGAMPIIAGSRKTWVNYEFAQPGRWSKQHEDHLQRGDQFPFAYNTIRDPLTNVTDGVLAECRTTATCPKIMHVDGEFEVWGARGSLLVTDGKPNSPKDLQIPDDVRLYMVAGTPHGGSNTIVPETPSFGICQQANTSLGSSAVIRALLLRLDRWVEHGVRPPRTDYGSAKAKTLVTSDREATGFPEIPGATYNGLFNYLRVTDYTTQPPAEGPEYGVRVPRVDKDGNSLAGIRLPAVQVPVATYTGWNLRAEGHAEGEVCSSAGSFIPLPQTRAERQESGDPRRSIAERYRNHDDYVRQFARAADGLVRDGYLLPVDADAMIAEADTLEVGAQ